MTPRADDTVEIYTDGACSGNPGPGGWGAILMYRGRERELSGGARDTTNNRMELTAAIKALDALKRPSKVRLYTDSAYLKNGITTWIDNWKARGWRTADKKAVKNEDLWRRLDALTERHSVSWRWIKAHSGDAGNERADALARKGMARYR